MIHPETHIVGKDAIRPAGHPNKCFYCQKAIGQEHIASCVMRERSVVMLYIFRVTVMEPEFWMPAQIEFHKNESSWCASNALADIQPNAAGRCPCDYFEASFLREATVEDEEFLAEPIKGKP